MTTDFFKFDRLSLATIRPVIVIFAVVGTIFMARRRQANHVEATAPILHYKRALTALFIL